MEVESVTHARFTALVDDVIDPVRRYLARRTDPDTAQDVLGDTLLVCWRRLDQVPDDAVPWTIGVARNCLANSVRSHRRRHRLLDRIRTLDPPQPLVTDSGADTGDTSPVTAALARLRPADAEVLRLWAWEDLAPREIAVVLEVSVNAATVRLHRAKKRLAAELGDLRERTTERPDTNGLEGGDRGGSW